MSSKLQVLLLFFLSTGLLFLGFDRNQWKLAPDDHFRNFDRGSESLVVGRMVWTRQHGLASDGALLGTGDAPSAIIGDAEFNHQYDTYVTDGRFRTYMLYRSQTGGQGWFFSLLDMASPLASRSALNLRVFHALTALLTALTLSGLIVWFYLRFGWAVSMVVLITSLFSRWLTVYGRNLFYSIWSYFLPMVVALYLLDRESRGKPFKEGILYGAAMILIFFKGFFSGYDFLLPPMGMVAAALVFYALKDKWGVWKFTRRLLLTGLASAVGVIGSFLILAVQIGSVTGNFSDGLLHIVNTMGRRTFGTPLDPSQSDFFAAGQEAPLFLVINSILSKAAVLARIHYTHIFILFAVVTVLCLLVLWLRRGKLGDTTADCALLATMWISFVSPLAWLVIFKAHAYYHPFTTAIVWHMPTMFFGYALIGLLFNLLFRRGRS